MNKDFNIIEIFYYSPLTNKTFEEIELTDNEAITFLQCDKLVKFRLIDNNTGIYEGYLSYTPQIKKLINNGVSIDDLIKNHGVFYPINNNAINTMIELLLNGILQKGLKSYE